MHHKRGATVVRGGAWMEPTAAQIRRQQLAEAEAAAAAEADLKAARRRRANARFRAKAEARLKKFQSELMQQEQQEQQEPEPEQESQQQQSLPPSQQQQQQPSQLQPPLQIEDGVRGSETTTPARGGGRVQREFIGGGYDEPSYDDGYGPYDDDDDDGRTEDARHPAGPSERAVYRVMEVGGGGASSSAAPAPLS